MEFILDFRPLVKFSSIIHLNALPDEMVIDIKDNSDGVFPTYLEINTPDIALKGSLIGFRIRLSNQAGLTPYGNANSGEVEDYLLGVDCPQVCLSITTNVVRDE